MWGDSNATSASFLEFDHKGFFPPSRLQGKVKEVFYPHDFFIFGLKFTPSLQHVTTVSSAPDEAGDHLSEDFSHLLQPDILGEFGWHEMGETTS